MKWYLGYGKLRDENAGPRSVVVRYMSPGPLISGGAGFIENEGVE